MNALRLIRFVVTMAVLGLASPVLAQEGEPVKVSDIRAQGVTGDLGLPLGTLVTVEGIVVDGDELRTQATSGRTLLRVEKVGETELPTPVMYPFPENSDLERPAAGESFSGVVYETGGFVGAPEGLFEHVEPFATVGFHFQTRLVWVAKP